LSRRLVNSALLVYTPSVYTAVVTGEIEGFDWDPGNVGHVLRHAVIPGEVEETVSGPHLVIPAKTIQGEKRWKLFGRTTPRRYLVVVFTIRGTASAPTPRTP
jgi:uncharacterized DUF497 family protein